MSNIELVNDTEMVAEYTYADGHKDILYLKKVNSQLDEARRAEMLKRWMKYHRKLDTK